MMKQKEINAIPFVKPVRVGNFKLWRSRVSLSYVPTDEERKKVREESGGKKKAVTRKYDLDVVNVSNLDGSWKVQVPQTSLMFGTIVNGFSTTDVDIRDQFLGMVFTNMFNVCMNSSEALHDAFFFVSEMLAFPYLLLSEKEMSKRMERNMKALGMDKKRIRDHISKMVEYRNGLYDLIEKKRDAVIGEYERQLSERMSKEKESLEALRQDEIAEQAMETLGESEAEAQD